jgi:hypothetical protein
MPKAEFKIKYSPYETILPTAIKPHTDHLLNQFLQWLLRRLLITNPCQPLATQKVPITSSQAQSVPFAY